MQRSLATLVVAAFGAMAQTTAPPAAQVPRPAPKIYSETADAAKTLATALHNAHGDGVRVFINWGANDCARCATFWKALRGPEVPSPFFSDEYDTVNVDVGHADRNRDLAAKYGVTLDNATLPAMTVLDGDGKVVAQATSRDFQSVADPAAFDTAKIVSFLTKHQAPPAPDALPVFEAALKQAKAADKAVFVWFSAPW